MLKVARNVRKMMFFSFYKEDEVRNESYIGFYDKNRTVQFLILKEDKIEDLWDRAHEIGSVFD
jgi:hypothetical protein